MSYLKRIEYEIITEESFAVIRNCAGCGKKTSFKNTKRFRVNANGNKLDVWLIYQCEKCKHTFNLAIHERQKAILIPTEEYQSFLENNEQLAEKYGRSLLFFKRNKAEVDEQNVSYHMEKLKAYDEDNRMQHILIVIHNPCGLKLRPERQMAEILGLSRNQIKGLLEKGEVRLETNSLQKLSFSVIRHIMLTGKE